MEKKQNIVKWLNVFFLIINLSAFVTFLLMNAEKPEITDEKFSSDLFLKEQLELTEEQYNEIVGLDQTVFRMYQILLDRKCEENFKLIDELSSAQPDPVRLDSIVSTIGRCDAGIKRQTIKHFNNIKSVCSDGQKELLGQLLKEMMEVGNQCKYCNKVNCGRRDLISKSSK